jgi:hypothetical protein
MPVAKPTVKYSGDDEAVWLESNQIVTIIYDPTFIRISYHLLAEFKCQSNSLDFSLF